MSETQLTGNYHLKPNNETELRFRFKPMNEGINFSMGDRMNDVEIENTSSLYMLGNIKPQEKCILSRGDNGIVKKIIKREGNITALYTYTNVGAYNDAKLTVDLTYSKDKIPQIIVIKNSSTRTDHTWKINFRPEVSNQELLIHCAGFMAGTPAKIRINFGTGGAKVLGMIAYSATASTGDQSTGTAHTHTTSDGTDKFVLYEDVEIGTNKYIEMSPNTSLLLRGIKKPNSDATDAYFWTIVNNLQNSALT